MNKADLQYKWGHLCDVDKLVEDVRELLNKYGHENTEHGVCMMLDEYFSNKNELITMFQKSEHYIGDMRIVLDIELERTNNKGEVSDFCYSFPNEVDACKAIYKYEDDDGKTLADYLNAGIKKVSTRDLLYGNTINTLHAEKEKRERFFIGGQTRESHVRNDHFNMCIKSGFRYNYQPKVQVDLTDYVNTFTETTIATGMKTSRAFNKVCTHYGVDKLPNYNKLFTQYADLVSGLKRKMKFFISVNPLDYLTMSFGNSWASCHTIDRQNVRQMSNAYRGEYCGGTMSYMLDSSSIITYIHNEIPNNFEEGKIYRNMFHYQNGTLVQGRIYPQGNDGATDLYKTFRGFVQDELAELLGLTNKTWVKKTNCCSDYVNTIGVHYPDYYYNSECNVTYPKELGSPTRSVQIGHERICVYCGEWMDTDPDPDYNDPTNRLNCCDCA